MCKNIFISLIILVTLNFTSFSQTISKSYHPYDPSIDGSFIINGDLNVNVSGKYTQEGTSLILEGTTESVVDSSWVWDIVHKPYGVGNYGFYLELSGKIYPLAELRVDNNFLHIEKLYNGTRVATSQFWSAGSKLSHWQVGQYLAVISPINNVQIPRCSKLLIKTTGEMSLKMVTVVTQKLQPCVEYSRCFKTPLELSSTRLSKDHMVSVTRFPITKRLFGLDYLKKIVFSRHLVDIYDSMAIVIQIEARLLPPKMTREMYDTSILVYSDFGDLNYDYTLGQVLNNYITSKPSSNTNLFFGKLLEQIVLSGNKRCKINIK